MVDRAVVRFTARIVSKLRTQIEGVDCMEKLDEGGQPMVWLLLKALYGLKQSGNLDDDAHQLKVLKKLGMKQSMADTHVTVVQDGPHDGEFFVHTDDGKVAYSDRAMLDELLASLRAEVTMGEETDDVKRMVNIAIEDSNDGESIKLNQSAYLEDMIDDNAQAREQELAGNTTREPEHAQGLRPVPRSGWRGEAEGQRRASRPRWAAAVPVAATDGALGGALHALGPSCRHDPTVGGVTIANEVSHELASEDSAARAPHARTQAADQTSPAWSAGQRARGQSWTAERGLEGQRIRGCVKWR